MFPWCQSAIKAVCWLVARASAGHVCKARCSWRCDSRAAGGGHVVLRKDMGHSFNCQQQLEDEAPIFPCSFGKERQIFTVAHALHGRSPLAHLAKYFPPFDHGYVLFLSTTCRFSSKERPWTCKFFLQKRCRTKDHPPKTQNHWRPPTT